jgi:hypothetical protein
MPALRINNVTKLNSSGREELEDAELWTYFHEDGALHLALTTCNGAGRATSVKLSPEQVAGLREYLNGL